jgi:hypothetical protein
VKVRRSRPRLDGREAGQSIAEEDLCALPVAPG